MKDCESMNAIIQNFGFKVALLILIWVILRGEFNPFEVIVGAVVGLSCVAYSRKFLPLKQIENVKFFRLFLYVFYLIGQMYLAGYHVVKLIIKGQARAEILTTKTIIENETLRVILGDSITLTPGSVMVDLSGDVLTVLYLAGGNEVIKPEDVDKLLKGSLEEKLLACQAPVSDKVE